MFKFLRRYNKWLLAIFGSLLMVVFLVPQAIEQFAQQSGGAGATWAEIGPSGRSVSVERQFEATRDLEIFQSLGFQVPGMGPQRNPAHWFLLAHEAEQAGLIANLGSIELPRETTDLIFERIGRNPTTEGALARFIGVTRLRQHYGRAAKFSDRRLMTAAEQMLHGVDARVVVLRAEDDDSIADPDEAAITAHFEAHRDIMAGPGRGDFGYRQPDRFRIETLHVPASAIRARALATGTIDGVALAMHWRTNPSNNVTFPPFERAAPVPDVVREDLITRTMNDVRGEIERFIDARLLEAQRGLAKSPEGFFNLPSDWAQRRTDLLSVAEALAETFPGLPRPDYLAITDRWLTFDDISSIESLTGATTAAFGPPVGAGAIIRSHREFSPQLTTIIAQAGVTSPALKRGDGGLVFMRVTEADAERPARDLTEVRDQVIQDLRLLAAFERLLERSNMLLAQARTDGMLSVALEAGRELGEPRRIVRFQPELLSIQIRSGQQVTPFPGEIPGLGSHLPTIRAIVEHALERRDTANLSTLPADERIISVPARDELAVTIAELFRQQPIDRDTVRSLTRAAVVQSLLLSEEIEVLPEEVRDEDPFSFASLAKRHNFVLRRVEQEENAMDQPG
jgi:hypothetical protein